MTSYLLKSLTKNPLSPSSPTLKSLLVSSLRSYAKASQKERVIVPEPEPEPERLDDVVPTSGISRPLSEILKELSKKVPDTLVKVRTEDGFSIKYIPWHIVNRIMNLHAPEWSGEVRSITYSADGKSVSVVYRVTLYGTDAEIFIGLLLKSRWNNNDIKVFMILEGVFKRTTQVVHLARLASLFQMYRESTGTALVEDTGYGDPVQKAEAMAFQACLCTLWSWPPSLS
uniref:DNA repair RAD52-like protein 1, mitochondrial n=1 Tax=Vitis vinifera TaxID=29760 RepID=A5C7M6_VITVI|nr:hypothetical protein VITISV_030205 [Vitis vinifera]